MNTQHPLPAAPASLPRDRLDQQLDAVIERAETRLDAHEQKRCHRHREPDIADGRKNSCMSLTSSVGNMQESGAGTTAAGRSHLRPLCRQVFVRLDVQFFCKRLPKQLGKVHLPYDGHIIHPFGNR